MTRKAKAAPADPNDGGPAWPSVLEYAVALLEDLPGPAWARIAELTAANLAGNLSYEAWRAACGALLQRTARGPAAGMVTLQSPVSEG